jgi:hypothetical protein
MNLSNKTVHEKKNCQMRELLKNHIGKYKEAGMTDKDINDYLNLYNLNKPPKYGGLFFYIVYTK